MKGPLEGLRVLDFSRVLAGPYCTMMMGDMGAEVLKVEEPARGDDTRAWGPPFQGAESAYFLSVNRNKKSLTLNLKTAAGLDLSRRLLARSDVLVENFRPGTMERIGLGYEQARAINRKLVYCSISGFGQSGPQRERPGYDAVVQGEGGIMSLTGFRDGPPVKVGVSLADLMAGLLAFQGILLALRVAEQSGSGQWVDVALLDGQIALLTFQAAAYFATGKSPGRIGNLHPMITPYETYRTSDGYIIIAIGNESLWQKFQALLSLPAGDRFSTSRKRVEHRQELAAILVPLLESRTTAAWLAELGAAGIPCGQVRSVADVLGDPQVLAREMVQEVRHATLGRLRTTGIPVKLSETPGSIHSAPPLLGAHTEEILRDVLELSAEQVNQLRAEGVI